MSTLTDTAQWEEGVPYFAENAVLTGGADCPDNIPLKALANRTAYLKQELESLEQALANFSFDAATQTEDGLMSSTDKTKLDGIEDGASATPDASTTTKGKVELATITETKAGTDTSRAVTPAGLKSVVDDQLLKAESVQTTTNDAAFENDSDNPASTNWVRGAMLAIATAAGFDCLLASNGFIKFPSWLGGLIFQWGTATTVTNNMTFTFPVTFPNSVAIALPGSPTSNFYVFYRTALSTSSASWAGTVASTGGTMPAGIACFVFAIGY